MKAYPHSWRWIIMGLVAVLIRIALPPALIEKLYSRAVYQALRAVWDHLLNSWLPVPLMYLLLLLALALLVQRTRRWWRLPDWRRRLAGLGMGILGMLGFLAFTFLMLWGYNYGRVPVETQLELDLTPISLEELAQRVQSEAEVLASWRHRIPDADTNALTARHFPDDLEDPLREVLEKTLVDYGFPVAGRVRARILYPKGIFLRFSSAGLFFPWSGEGHIDAGLIPVQRPYTMTHELAHGYGFGDEGACSFWAYVAGIQSTNPALVYATRLGYWRTLASNWLRAEPEAYEAFRTTLDRGIVNDLNAINVNLLAYPDILPHARYAAYDAYLKAQGISEGMLNYNRVVLLVEAWEKKGGLGD